MFEAPSVTMYYLTLKSSNAKLSNYQLSMSADFAHWVITIYLKRRSFRKVFSYVYNYLCSIKH